jgi:hypothetical protein
MCVEGGYKFEKNWNLEGVWLREWGKIVLTIYFKGVWGFDPNPPLIAPLIFTVILRLWYRSRCDYYYFCVSIDKVLLHTFKFSTNTMHILYGLVFCKERRSEHDFRGMVPR